jgi:hypothetical protein
MKTKVINFIVCGLFAAIVILSLIIDNPGTKVLKYKIVTGIETVLNK